MTERRIRKLKYEIQKSRSRIIDIQPVFAETLKNAVYVADSNVYRITTNGEYIFFDPDWLQKLKEEELDFILAHQVMHIELCHIDRSLYYKGERFHLACDIIANAYLYRYGWEYDALSHIGTIYRETFFPKVDGLNLTPEEAMKKVPFDPAREKSSRRKYVIDSDEYWENKENHGESGTIILVPGETDPFDTGTITKSENVIHRKGKRKENKHTNFELSDNEPDEKELFYGGDYSPHKSWTKKSIEEIRILEQIKDEDQSFEHSDEKTRIWKMIRKSQLDWRKLLNVFVREELCDYSFTPPDRRFQDTDFFLPDYNVLNEKTKNILFMVDTSVSVDDEMLSAVYSELCSALYQFGDSLEGILAFFDTRVYQPVAFSSISELKSIDPVGGGATDFRCIFDFIYTKMKNDLPLKVVIFTDGKGDFPDEKSAGNIPVLWMITNIHSLPKWGQYVIVQ